MPIVSSDIKIRLSVKTGSAGNSTAQGNVNNSLGKYISTTDVGAGANNLFDDISGDENAASTVDYRCIFFYNTHETLTYLSPKVWLSAEVSGGASIAIAVDDIAASLKDASSAQAAEIATETTTPTGVGTFASPTSKGTGLSLGNLEPGYCRAIWIKRTAANSAALNNDGVTIRIEGDTQE